MAFTVNGFAEDTWTVAGTAAALNDGTSDWSPANADNDMTSSDGTNYTLEVTNRTLEKGTTYGFKVVKNHSWDEAYPGSNKEFSVGETAKYTVTYTFNADTKEVGVSTTKTGEAGAITHTYTVAGSPESLFVDEWAPGQTANDMTVNGDGLYEWSKSSVDFLAGDVIAFKVCVDHAWGTAYPADDYTLTIPEDGTYDVVITFNEETKEVKATAKKPFSATFDNGGDWVNVYAYAYTEDGSDVTKFLGDWPGTALTKSGDVWRLDFNAPQTPEKIIFNNGDHGIQTADLVFVEGKAYTYTIDLAGDVIWESETPVAASWWSDPYELKIAKEKFASAKVGDLVHVAVGGVTPNSDKYNAQVALKDGWWTDIDGGTPVGEGNVEQVTYTLTGDMLAFVQERGMVVSGNNYTTRKVTLESVAAATGSEKSIWLGNSTGNVTVNVNHFKNANNNDGIKAGDIIRVHATLTEGYTGDKWMLLSYSGEDTSWSWKNYTGMDATAVEGGFDFIVNEDNVAEIKTDGIIVNNGGYTVTAVELISGTVTGYYIINNLGSGWVVGDAMTADEGVYSATLSDMGGKFFAIAPNTALNVAEDAIVNWAKVVRPVTLSGDFVVNNFVNYADETTTGTDNTWSVAADNNATLTLTYTAATGAYTLTTDATVEVAISAAGYATYSNSQQYEISGAEAVYIVKELTASKNAELYEVTGAIPAGAGVIVKGSEKFTVALSTATTTADVSESWLIGSNDYTYDITGTYPAEMGGGSYTGYILADGSHGVGFYEIDSSDNTIAAHKAFLAVPESAGARAFIGFGDTTGIMDINREATTNNRYYTLDGRLVENPTKGIYIVNGKKVVVK